MILEDSLTGMLYDTDSGARWTSADDWARNMFRDPGDALCRVYEAWKIVLRVAGWWDW